MELLSIYKPDFKKSRFVSDSDFLDVCLTTTGFPISIGFRFCSSIYKNTPIHNRKIKMDKDTGLLKQVLYRVKISSPREPSPLMV